MEELLFIINPTAASGRAKGLKSVIEENMKKYNRNFEIIMTEDPKDATDIAYKSKINTIVAVGGDGTITEVAQGILKRGFGVLGIVPGGTGNDFRKSLDISDDTAEAIETLIKGRTIKVDVGIANGYEFLNIGGIGLDVEVLRTLRDVKKHVTGSVAYIIALFISLIKFKKMSLIIEIDKERREENLAIFGAGNGKYFGGGLQLIPQAINGDGYLDLTLVKDISNLRIVTIFPEIFKGTHLRHKKYVETYKFKEAILISKKDMYMNLDGEIFSGGKEIKFSLADEQLEVLVPQ